MKCWVSVGLFLILTLSFQGHANSDVWILIDTSEQRLSVMQGSRERLVFSNIAIGRYGASNSRMKGGNQTPFGSFKISWIKRHHRYHQFFGINFPNREAADLALSEKRISRQVWSSITKAIESSKLPPQNTPLGGYIGIHGIGRGDHTIHARFNWTNGCVALTNTQIDELSSWVKMGMKVIIR